MSLETVKKVVIETRQAIGEIMETVHDEKANILKDKRLTPEGKNEKINEIMKQARQGVAELAGNISPQAEKAVEDARTQARKNMQVDQEAKQQKAQAILPLIRELDVKQLIGLYEKRASDPVEAEVIKDVIELQLDLKPDSAEKVCDIKKFEELQTKALEAGQYKNENETMIQAGNLHEYAQKLEQITALDLKQLEGENLSTEENVLKRRLDHEASQFEKAYSI